MALDSFSISELMAVCMAREIRNGDKVLQGLYSPLPMLACNLAKRTHAPDMVYFNVADAIDPQPDSLPRSTAAPHLAKGCVGFIDLAEVFDIAQRGELDMVFLGAAQVDKYGNTNLSVIGDYNAPKVRLPGGAASSFLCGVSRRTVLWVTKQSKRSFVGRVDFITGQGYLDGRGSREKSGLRYGGPSRVITNLGVHGFDEETKRMKVESVHPEATVEDLIGNTGFELLMPPMVPKTKPPTDEQLRIIRELDPLGVRELEFR